MNSSTISLEDFKRLATAGIQAELESARTARYESVAPLTLLTLALVPEWTHPLARSAFGHEVEAALVHLQETGQIELIQSPLLHEQSPETTIYKLLMTKREELVQAYCSDMERRAELEQIVPEIGARICTNATAGISPLTKRWATLARHFPYGLVETFEAEIQQAFAQKTTAEVLNWIEAARPLSDLLKRNADLSLELALHRAGPRIELFRRAENDQRHLRTYLLRQEQDAAFHELMEGPDELWALHYIGVGGVGKTMFIRHLQTELAPQYDAVTARIDFDFLNPDYPRLSPGLLLWAFAQELLPYDTTGRATELFNKADRNLRQLHDELRLDQQRFAGQRPTNHPGFREALSLYTEAFRQISPRLVLILDTCEELAKVNVGSAVPENVEETFRILRALHDGCDSLDADDSASYRSGSGQGIPGLRLIFSGRRPLAQAGYQWSCNNLQIKERPYLRLREIRGFSPTEAHAYLTHENQLPPVPEHLLDAIIEKSKPTSRVPALRFDEAERPASETSLDDKDRCNPYELKLYADWAKEDPPPTADTIRHSSQAKYVELRIIQRLQDKRIEKLLPAVALLGHFDRATLQACCDLRASDLDEALEKLQQEDWIAQRLVTDGQQTQVVCDVEPRMRARLATYYTERGSDLSQLRQRAAAHLEEVTLHGDLQALDWATFDAALRALEADPPRAARWWQQAEARLFAERDAKWVLEVTRALQGDDGAARRQLEEDTNTAAESWMRPLVLATHAAALLQSDLGKDVSGIWAEVTQKCARIPAPDSAARLQLRACAGSIAANQFVQTTLITEVIHDFWRQVAGYQSAWDAQLAAALVAAAETIVEKAEQLAESDLTAAQGLLRAPNPSQATARADGLMDLVTMIEAERERWAAQMPREMVNALTAFAHSLAGRAACLVRDFASASSHFSLAINYTVGLDTKSYREIWYDWRPPMGVAARIRLEFARATYPVFLSPAETLQQMRKWERSTDTSIDSERLHSIILRLQWANRLIHPDEFPPGWNMETFQQDKFFRAKIKESLPETCNAHRLVPPLWATMSEVLAANGEVDLPLQRLGQISSQATLYLTDTVRHAERAHSRIVRRMRLRDTGQGMFGSLVDSPRLSDAELIWTLEGMDGEKNQKPIPALPAWIVDERNRQAALHAIWRTRYAGNEQKARAALAWAREYLTPYAMAEWDMRADFYQLSLNLDLLESRLLAAHDGQPLLLADRKPNSFDLLAWMELHPLELAAAARLWVRCQELGVRGDFAAAPLALLDKLGALRWAEITLEEKELLALRLPGKIAFSPEKTRFTLSEDFVSATIAGVLAAVFSGQSVRALRVEYDNLRHTPIYQASMMTPLPAWEELEQLAAHPQAGFLAQLQPVGWRPLFARIIFCLAREQRNDEPVAAETPPQRPTQMIQQEIEQAFGLRNESQSKLPPDWDWLFQRSAGAVNASPPSASKTRWGLAIAGFAMLLGLFAGGFFVFRWVMSFFGSVATLSVKGIASYVLCLFCLGVAALFGARWYRGNESRLEAGAKLMQGYLYAVIILITLSLGLVMPSLLLKAPGIQSFLTEFGWVAALLLPAGIVTGYLGVPRLVKTTQEIFASFSRLTLEVKRHTAGGTATLLLSRQSSDLRKMRPPTWSLMHYDYPAVEVHYPNFAAYQQMAQSLPPVLATEFRERALEAGERTREVILKLEDKTHEPSWEAMIAYQLHGATTTPQDINLHFRRTVNAQRTAARAQLQDVTEILLFTNNWLLLTQGWSQCQGAAGMTVSVLDPEQKKPASTEQILHLIGEAETTSAGIRWMSASNEALEKNLNWKAQESSYFDAAYDSMRSPEDIRREYPLTSLCILQGKPLLQAQARLESDRRDAQKLRQFAGELFAQGVPAVLVLPALPLAVGSEVINQLAATIARRPRDAGHAMLKTIAEIRAAIVALQPAEPDAAWEEAFDVCLYCTDDWYGLAEWVQKALVAGEHKPWQK